MSRFPRISAKKALLLLVTLGVVGGGAAYYFLYMNDTPLPPPPAPVAMEAPVAPLPPVPAVVSSAEALPAFEAEKASGTLTFATTKTLADAYAAEQDATKAVETYDTYLAQTPDDVAAIEARSKLLQGLGREDEYKAALARLADLEPTEARLTEFSTYLNGKQLYAEQLVVLHKLNEITQKQKPELQLSIVDVAMAAGDKAAALQAFADYQALPNAKLDAARAKQYVELLTAEKHADDALNFALTWSKAQADGSNNAALAGALLNQGAPIQAIAFLDAVKPAEGPIPADMQKLYAEAYIAQGDHAKALPILKELRANAVDGEYEESYFIALANVAKKDENAREELRTLVKDQFASGKLTEAQKMDRVYALLDIGDKTLAIDYADRSLQASAEDSKEKWSALYKSLTAPAPKQMAAKSSGKRVTKATSGKASSKRVASKTASSQGEVTKAAIPAPSVALDKRLSLATRPGMSDKFVRETAFEALNAGRKQDAIKLFAQLAMKNGPESSDGQQLMYLLGARIGQQEMAWLTSAAKQSKGARRAAWIETIAASAPDEGIVAAGELNPDWLAVPAFEKRYAQALAQLGQNERMDAYMQTRGTQTSTADSMVMQASTAFANGNVVEGERLLSAAASAPAASKRTYISIAELSMSRGRYTQARSALDAATRSNSSAMSAADTARENVALNFNRAVLARRDGNGEAATASYAAALKAAEGQKFDDRGTQVKLLSAQMALGQTADARRGYEALLKQNPQDEALLADYLSALLDQKRYAEARLVANNYGGKMTGAPAAAVAPVVMDASGTLQVPTDSLALIQPMSGGRELKLQFNRPLPQNFVPQGVSPKPEWLSYYTVSYDSVVIAAMPGYSLRSDPSSQVVTISGVANNAGGSTTMMADGQSYLRLQLLYARTELESDEVDKALNRLNALDADYANVAEYKAYQANAEYYAANPKRALKLVKDAQRRDPANEDIAHMRRTIERFHAEHFKLDHEWYKLGSAKQNITTMEARAQYDGGFEATARLQNSHIDTGIIQRTKGAPRAFTGNKLRGEIEVAKFMDDSAVVAAQVFGNNDTAGAGLSYQFANSLGTTGVYAEYHKPYWDVPEAVVADTVRDRVGVSHWWRPSPEWTTRGEVAFNRYSVDVKSNIVDSMSVQADVIYTLQDLQPYMALAYSFNGEYLNSRVKRNYDSSPSFKYLPLRSREVHSLSALFSQDLDTDTIGELNLGYAVDRLGDHGPIAEGRITHYVADDFDVQLRGRYGFEPENANEDNAATVGGYARWTW